jgi:hypothetical protein
MLPRNAGVALQRSQLSKLGDWQERHRLGAVLVDSRIDAGTAGPLASSSSLNGLPIGQSGLCYQSTLTRLPRWAIDLVQAPRAKVSL